jgi:hypothetical protein
LFWPWIFLHLLAILGPVCWWLPSLFLQTPFVVVLPISTLYPIYIIMISIDHWLANAIDNERECKFWEYVSLLNNKFFPPFFRLKIVLPAVLLHSPMTVCVRHGTVFMAIACSCPFSYASFFVVGWIRGGVQNGTMSWNVAVLR